MSNLSEREEFRRRLGNIITLFRQHEDLIRSQYNAAREAGTVPNGDAPSDLLERPTRRFLDGSAPGPQAFPSGRKTLKVLPRPGSLSTVMRPPRPVTIPWQMDRPSPVP